MHFGAAGITGDHVRNVSVLGGEVPGQRGCQVYRPVVGLRRNRSTGGVVENQTQPALVLAAELAHLQRARFRTGLPIHVARRVLWHVFANSIEIGTTTAHIALQFTIDEWEDFVELVGGVNRRVNNNLPPQRNMPGLGEKCKGKTCGQTEAVFTVTAAPIEVQFQIGR